MAAGVDAARTAIISYGEVGPFVLGHDESAWKWNRFFLFNLSGAMVWVGLVVGLGWLTPLYDPLIRWLMPEVKLKTRLVEQAGIERGHRVLDLGCGTGTLAILVENIRGLLPEMLRRAGFDQGGEPERFTTLFGNLSLYTARKS